jgi:hypothetical protein
MRQFNKYRHQFPLGKDDNGKQLYPWDFIKVFSASVNKTEWCTDIYMNFTDGAYFPTHPFAIERNDGIEYHEMLSDFLPSRRGDHDKTIVKITEEEHDIWVKEYQIRKRVAKPREFYLPSQYDEIF